MAVQFHHIYPGARLHVSLRRVRYCIERLVLLEGFTPGNINVIFCSTRYIYNLNITYLKHFYPTDVITFDYSAYPVLSGDIFIGVDVVRANARLYSQSFQNELLRVILHGVLHLCGYKDKTPVQRKMMREKEDYYLKLFSNYAG
ncbi:MAG: rRNA maturation RNase YbeY [Bacteroidales bacterium]